jgi:hypothetical protein
MRAARLLFALALLVACDEPTSPRLASGYVLHSVNGQPVPAATDTAPPFPGSTDSLFVIVQGRSIRFLSSTLAQYTRSSGARRGELLSEECSSQRVTYERDGRRIVLVTDPNVPVGPTPPQAPLQHDTLWVQGDKLIQTVVRPVPSGEPSPRTLRFEYVPGEATALCGPG